MKKPLYTILLIFFTAACVPSFAHSQDNKVFETEYSAIYYTTDAELSDFLWRVGGYKMVNSVYAFSAQNRIDRIIEQVEKLLDMHPERFRLTIYLKSGYKEGDIASYSEESKAITVYVDRITDGVLAHEVGHAVICSYFEVPPPRKVQEILCQYVDSHLWEEYQ